MKRPHAFDQSLTKIPKTASTPNIDKQFGYVDIKKLEYSARLLQKNIKIIIDEAPDIETLNRLIHSNQIDSLTFDSLKTNALVHLASQLKSLYDIGDIKIFDHILNNDFDDARLRVDMDHQREFLDTSTFDFKVDSSNNATEKSNDDGDESPSSNEPYVDDQTLPELPKIKDPHLYTRIFIHKSTINNKSYLPQSELVQGHNERLEFLGDSVLNNVVTIILYNRYPAAAEGELSKMRSLLVNNVTLAEFSLNYGFDKKLQSNINEAILRQGKQKVFADIFEAYVGALAIENNLELGKIKDWLHKLFTNRLNQFDSQIEKVEEVNKDAKSELYSLVGTAGSHPIYKVIVTGDGASVPFKVDCMMNDEVLGTGIAPGLKEAGLRAAMMALKNKPLLERYIQLRLNNETMRGTINSNESVNGFNNIKLNECPPSQAELSYQNYTLPLNANPDEEVDINARNQLYGLLSKHYQFIPEYVCEETDDKLFSAELRVDSKLVAIAKDVSKKRAMARAAKVVLDNPLVLNYLNS